MKKTIGTRITDRRQEWEKAQRQEWEKAQRLRKSVHQAEQAINRLEKAFVLIRELSRRPK